MYNTLNEFCYKKEKYMRVPTETAKQLYFYAEWAGEFECKKDFYIHRSNLNSYLMIYTVSGRGILNCEGNTYTVGKGSLILLDCKTEHEYYTDNEPWIFKYIHFNGNLSKEYYDFINHIYGTPIFLCGIPNFENMLDKVICGTKKFIDEAIVSEYIYRIITALICGCNDSQGTFDLKKVMDYVSDNYMDITDVNSIAETFNFSRSYFTVQFTKAAGVTPYDYLIRCRISAAKQMLENTNFSVGRISEACGFNGCSSFIRTFKRKTGMSPLGYKKTRE